MSILEMAEEESAKHGHAQVEAVHVRLGAFSGVTKEALVGAFEVAREGTELKGCRLEIEEVPVVIFCRRCQAEREVMEGREMRCGVCGELSRDLRKGREMEITAMEIET
ncbi:MAG: hydrogenase maturation nickel metallochaperone HypA [Phycisphaerales bacterium]|nr:hydrogenase maturation nickel metallochaperone HypA [Phycisphaerales bacterium]